MFDAILAEHLLHEQQRVGDDLDVRRPFVPWRSRSASSRPAYSATLFVVVPRKPEISMISASSAMRYTRTGRARDCRGRRRRRMP